MPSPGWYSDPSTPSRLRFWDGESWTEQTAEQPPPTSAPPTSAPPTSPPPTQPPPAQPPPSFTPASAWPTPPPTPPYGATSYAGGPGESGGSGKSTGKIVGLVALVLVLVALVATAGVFGVRALTNGTDEKDDPGVEATDDPTDEPTDEPTNEPTDEPTDEPTAPPAPTEPASDECLSGVPELRQDHPIDGDVYGGGLTIPSPEGYFPAELAFTYTFASDVEIVGRELPGNYIATFGLGEVSRESFDSVQTAAQQVVICITESEDFYRPDARRSLGATMKTTVDGNQAWSAQAKMRIDDAAIPGGIIRVIAVDLGDPESFGLFVGIVPIGDRALIVQRDQVIRTLKAG